MTGFLFALRVDSSFSSVCEPGEVLTLPVAHGEGRFVADDAVLEELEHENPRFVPLLHPQR